MPLTMYISFLEKSLSVQVPFKNFFSAQSCPNLCNPMDYNLPVSSVHGIFQARILEWVAISNLNVGKHKRAL